MFFTNILLFFMLFGIITKYMLSDSVIIGPYLSER